MRFQARYPKILGDGKIGSVQSGSGKRVSGRRAEHSHAARKRGRIEPLRGIALRERRTHISQRVWPLPRGEFHVLTASALQHVEWRATLQRENAAELPAGEKNPRRALEALSPRKIPHVSGDKAMPDIVQAAGAFRSAIARVLALACSAIDSLRAVVDEVRPGVMRIHADAFCEPVLVPGLERVIYGVAARVDH